MITRFRFFLPAAVMFLTVAGKAFGAAGEAESFDVIEQNFKGFFYERAESLSVEFIQKFPASPRLPDVILYQARSRLEQSNYTGAMQLLVANENAVGARKDEIVFWMGEIRLREGKYADAAKLFQKVIAEFTSSARRAPAALKLAVAGAKMENWQNVVDVLGAKGGVFQQEASTN